MQRWNPPLYLLLALSLACACSSKNGLVVVVTVDPPDSGEPLVELRATVQIDGKTASLSPIDPIKVQPGTPTRFSLKLDQGTRGKLDLTVEGRPDYAYVTHKGTSTVQIDEDRRYESGVTLAIQRQCTDTGWCWEHTRPRGNALFDVWGTGPNDIWAVGEGGTILHYDGWAFSSVPILDEKHDTEPVTNPIFTTVHGTSATDVWAISQTRGRQSQRYSLCKYDADLRQFRRIWRSVVDQQNIYFQSLWVTKDVIWIDGISWNRQRPDSGPVPVPPEPMAVPDTVPKLTLPVRAVFYRVFSNNSNELWAVGSIYDSSKSPNDTPAVWHLEGSSWVQEQVDSTVLNTNDPLYHIWGTTSDNMWVSSRKGSFNLKRNGQKWEKDSPQYPNHDGIIYGENQAHALLAISGDILEKKQPSPPRLPKTLFRRSLPTIDQQVTDGLGILRAFPIQGQNSSMMYLVGEGGLIQKYEIESNRLTTMIPGSNESSAHLNDIFGFSGTDVWAVGNRGTILHYSNGSWAEATSKITQNNLRAVWGSAADDVWAVGDNATILHRTSLSGGFAAVTSPVLGNHLNAVWGTSAQNVYIAGNNSTLLRWNGTSWMTATNPGFSGNYQGVWAKDESNVFVAGFSGSTGYVFKGDGTNWVDITPSGTTLLSNAINKIRGSSTANNIVITNGTIYGNAGGAYTFIYNGSIWASVSMQGNTGVVVFDVNNAYIAGYEDALFSIKDGSTKRSIGGSNFFNALWGTDSKNMWAVGDSGTILHYQGLTPP